MSERREMDLSFEATQTCVHTSGSVVTETPAMRLNRLEDDEGGL